MYLIILSVLRSIQTDISFIVTTKHIHFKRYAADRLALISAD